MIMIRCIFLGLGIFLASTELNGQDVFLQYKVNTFFQFNQLSSEDWTRKEIHQYYRLKVPVSPSVSACLGINFKNNMSIMISRNSIAYAVRGQFDQGSDYTVGGGLYFMNRFGGEWSLQISKQLKKKGKFSIQPNLFVNYLKKENGFIPQYNSGYVGQTHRYWIKVFDSDSFYVRTLRIGIGSQFAYQIKQKYSIGLSTSFQFPGRKIFERSITVDEAKLDKPHQFKEINYGKGIELSIFLRYMLFPIKSKKAASK